MWNIDPLVIPVRAELHTLRISLVCAKASFHVSPCAHLEETDAVWNHLTEKKNVSVMYNKLTICTELQSHVSNCC